MRGGGDRVHGKTPRRRVFPQTLQRIRIRENIRLVRGDNLRPSRQLRIILAQFRVDRVEIRHGVPSLTPGHIHHMDQQTAAVNMPQKIVPQTGPRAGPLNQSGNVRHDKAASLVYRHHAQIGDKRGKRIARDFGPGAGDNAEQGRFSRVRKTNQPHVRQQF